MSEDFKIDWDRAERTGVPEAVLCGHKSPEQIAAIVENAEKAGRRLMLTRLEMSVFQALPSGTRTLLAYDRLSATATLGDPIATVSSRIGIVCAGTSDLPVAREAAQTLAFNGYEASLIADVGVAGLWRLTERLPEIRQFRIIIAVAGMEGALFSVLAGLVRVPIIAVPTSVGYGVADGGRAALHSALASCSPGILTVNIDNGFGAAAAAIKMLETS